MSELNNTHLAGMMVALAVPVAAAANFIIFKKAGQESEMIPTVFLGGGIFSPFDVAPGLAAAGIAARYRHHGAARCFSAGFTLHAADSSRQILVSG
jgi:hypothetical protein